MNYYALIKHSRLKIMMSITSFEEQSARENLADI
jgi:hypothetical protein